MSAVQDSVSRPDVPQDLHYRELHNDNENDVVIQLSTEAPLVEGVEGFPSPTSDLHYRLDGI